MKTERRSWIGLMAMAALTLAGGCGEDEITGPTTNGDPPEPPEPPAVSAPDSPTDVSVTVQENNAWVRWTPGDRAATQDIVLTNLDGLEPDRVKQLTTAWSQLMFTGLKWGASYSVVVAAVNEGGRAESAPAGFEISIPEAPALTWFSATADPTCLIVEWTASGPAEGHRVVLTGATEDASFEEAVHPLIDAEFCAADYPILDGVTYTAQVVAEFDGLDVASNTREFTVDFDPEYSLTGAWRGGLGVFGNDVRWSLHLVDVDGDISGAWRFVDAFGSESSGRVEGTRTGGDFELALGDPIPDTPRSGGFEGPDRVWMWFGPAAIQLHLQRE